jgi:transposase InsO family protein
MPGPVAGMFFYLYLIVDIYSRKIVGWEVHERESAELAATLIRRAVMAEGCITRPLVLHADNGSPMNGVCQRSCPPISCGVSDFRGADFGFGVEPDRTGGLPVAGFA